MEIDVIYYENNTRENQIYKTIEILNSVQNYFFFKLKKKEVDVCETKMVNWDVFCRNYSISSSNCVIYITQKPFDDFWFSHDNYKYAIITTNDWEEHFAPPSLGAYLVYQIAQAVVGFYADINEETSLRLGHSETKGCMFDFCARKKDIKFGMATGVICPKCRSILSQFGIEKEILNSIEKMLSYVRSETIGRPMKFNSNEAFIIMRFSEYDENDNAYQYGIHPALEMLNIGCLRADDRVVSGQLLLKVRQFIEESRFIIVKVDSENLNVYFELGLAMGLDKDVLLISEKDLILQLPSDLRNWECLTYSKGNYKELKEKIVKYYRENYHY